MLNSPSDPSRIYEGIPHAGSMRLLDRILKCDEQSILCSARSHVSAENPLRAGGALAKVHALEYAAQAMAIHGRYQMRAAAAAADLLVYVASFQDVEMSPGALGGNAAELQISATLDAAAPGIWKYGFSVTSGDAAVARGRAVVVSRQAPR